MSNLLDQIFGRQKRSARQAKERLRTVLAHDRTDLNPGRLDQLKDELIQVVSRHVEIDASAVRLQMTQEGRQQRLIADIPLNTSAKRRVG
jgi:cell division topological specificity factor